MSTLRFFLFSSSLSWRMQKNEVPLKIFLSTFAIRILCQSLFFVWIANVLGGERMMKFALYGNVLIPAVHILMIDVFNVIREEIDEQRLDLLTISKSSLLLIVIGRSIVYFLKAFLIIIFTYSIIGSLLTKGLEHWIYFISALPLLLLFALSAYCLGVFLSSLNFGNVINQMIPNTVVVSLMLVGNFTIPVESLPRVMQVVSEFLPLRHGVDAFRDYMVSHVPYWTNINFYLEIMTMAIYGVVGYAIYLYSVKKARLQPIK